MSEISLCHKKCPSPKANHPESKLKSVLKTKTRKDNNNNNNNKNNNNNSNNNNHRHHHHHHYHHQTPPKQFFSWDISFFSKKTNTLPWNHGRKKVTFLTFDAIIPARFTDVTIPVANTFGSLALFEVDFWRWWWRWINGGYGWWWWWWWWWWKEGGMCFETRDCLFFLSLWKIFHES